MDFSEISIRDKELFDTYLKRHHPQASELTFTNFFMWRNFYGFRYTVISGLLCVISVPEEGEPFAFPPIGSRSADTFGEAAAKICEVFERNGWKPEFRRVTQEELTYFGAMADINENVVPDRDNSDYVYLAQDLIQLSGKRFDGKRNHINRFKREHVFEYAVVGNENLEDCFDIMNAWCAQRNCYDHRELYCEKKANTELLNNYGELGCKGALIKVDGKFEAFTVGEMLNSDTAVIHIEKADSSVNGLYTLINQQFCQHTWQQATYINREQDLGREGLRKAKLSYNPVKLIEKYTVRI